METKLSEEEKNAIHGIFAAGLGIGMFYIRNNWISPSLVAGAIYELIFIFVLYMYGPFVVSKVCLEAGIYFVNLARGAEKLSVRTIALFLGSILAVCYIIFGLQEGIVLILLGILLVFRILLKLRID